MTEAEIAKMAILGMVAGYMGFFSPNGAWLGVAFISTMLWLNN